MQALQMRLRERLIRAIKDKVFPGVVIGVVLKTGERIVLPIGNLTYGAYTSPVHENTVYDVASVTKAIPTAALLLTLIDKGSIKLESPVSEVLPNLASREKRKVKIRHLLTYTLDLDVPALASLRNNSPDEIISAILSAPLKTAPGETLVYANSTAILMGMVITYISGMTLGETAESYFFRPLGMLRTTFHPLRGEDINMVAPTEFDESRGGLLQGVVHDEGTWVLQHQYTLGAAGLFSSAPDLLTFLEMLLHEGEKGGRRYLSQKIVRQMYENHTSDIGQFGGLGWELNKEWMGADKKANTFGKSGFTGCSVMCDPDRGVGIVLLSNHIHPQRPATRDAINAMRKDVADIVFNNL